MNGKDVARGRRLARPILTLVKTLTGRWPWLRYTLSIVLLAPALVAAQGFPGNTFAPGQRVMTLADEDGRKSRLAYHEGYLYTADQNRRRVRLWDIANASNPFVVRTFGNVGGSHAYGRARNVIVFAPDAAFRATEPGNPQRFTLASSLGSDREFYYPWKLTHHDGYGTPAGALLLGDASSGEIFSNPDPLGDAGVAGKAILIGNLLIYASLHSTSGIATYDVSDPRNPVLLDSISGIGAYEPAVFGHWLTLAVGRNNRDLHGSGEFDRGITIVDFSNPSDLRVVATISADDLSGDHRYMQFQDQFMFVGTNKVDMDSLRVVQRFADAGGGAVDYLLPVGHLVALGQRVNGDVEIFAHQSGLDTRAPTVAYHLPVDGALDQPVSGRIGVIIHETLNTSTLINKQTFVVRPIGGAPIDGTLFANDMDILTFTPAQALLPNTTYEVVLPAGGIEDVAGNAIEGHSFSFSTGAAGAGNNASPVIENFGVSSYPAEVGEAVELDVTASDANGDSLEFRFDFGDGTPQTGWIASSRVTHRYADQGHHRAQVQVRDQHGAVAVRSLVVTVADPAPVTSSTNSGPIMIDVANRLAWAVNPDNDSVTALDVDSLEVLFEVPVGKDPRSVALAPDGSVWVACHDADRIDVLDGNTGSKIDEMPFAYGSAPFGVVFSPDGTAGYVSLQGSGELIQVEPGSRSVSGVLPLGPNPRALAVSGDGRRVLVTRFISSRSRGEVWDVDASDFTLANTIGLAKDAGPDSASSGRGIPNYLASIAVSPDGRRAWVASKKDNVDRGVFSDGTDLTFENTVRAIVSKIDMAAGREVLAERIDSDNNDSLAAVEFSPFGDYAFVAVQGNNRVEIIDAFDDTRVTQIASGLAPQGLRFDSLSGRLFVKDFMSRTITVYETREFLQRGDIAFAPPVTISTVGAELLESEVLHGKQIFYNAGDSRMSRDGYLSCASCHVNGGADGRVWDFTGRGEGLRNTIALRGRGGADHGPLHWSANFDEIQDFENDIRDAFGGSGFMDDTEFQSGTRSDPLGDTKAGHSDALDDLAAYMESLVDFGRSPYRNVDGSLTDSAIAGRALFRDLECARCHGGEAFTDSAAGALHDVGTLKASSGQRGGGRLSGLDTPTLRGLWESAPYLHDGSAATLLDVISTEDAAQRHGETSGLNPQQQQQLVAYLLQIDDNEPPAAAPTSANERLDNGSFEQGLVGWRTQLSGSSVANWSLDSSTSTAGEQSLRVDVLADDGTDWHAQFYQGARQIVSGETYRVSFDVRASNAGVIRANVMQNHAPWQNLGFRETVAVTQSWQRHSFEFVASDTDGEARLSFVVGGEGPRSVWFDNVSFEHVQAPSEDELLDNGSFEQGLTGWQTFVRGGADAAWRVDDGERTAGRRSLRADVRAVDGTDWHAQFYQGGRLLVAGATYRVSFSVKATRTGTIRANVMQNHDPWRNLGFQEAVGVTPGWQRHDFEFAASQTDNEARLSFVIGGEGPRTIWFDNVSLEKTSSSGPQPPRACAVCGGDCSRCGGNRTVWVDQRNGKDSNNGLSRTQAVKTIARGARIVRGGDVMVVRPGTYYEKPAFRNLGSSASAPVWIVSEFPGEAVISGLWKAAAEGTQSWQSRGNGVYSARHGDAYTGSYSGAFLFHYNSLSDLTKTTINGVRKPPYGFASDGSTFYLRLPGNANPNGKPVELTDSFRQTLVTIENSPYVILDGFHLTGAGNEKAVNVDARSHHVTLRNLVITHSRHAAVLPNDSILEWSEYSYPHFREFVDDLIDLNGESSKSVFDLVKRYYSNGGNAYLEGGIATSRATESLNAEFRYNFIHDVFDGERLGNFSNSVTHHNVYNYNYDDHIELESWRSTHNSRNLRVHDNLFLNCAGAPLSHQDTSSQMRGPHYVYRNVIYQTDRRHAHPAYLIKNRNLARTRPGIYYYHNVLHNVKGTTGWGNINWLYWDNRDGDPQFLTFRNNIVLFDSLTDNGHNEDPDSSHNVLVNDRDNTVVRGRGGKYLGRDASAVRFNDLPSLDFGLQANSPAVDAGTRLPSAWPDSHRVVGAPDAGAFELGETPGAVWPRPRRTTFTASKPDRWNR